MASAAVHALLMLTSPRMREGRSAPAREAAPAVAEAARNLPGLSAVSSMAARNMLTPPAPFAPCSKAAAEAIRGNAQAQSIAIATSQLGNAKAMSSACATAYYGIAKSCSEAQAQVRRTGGEGWLLCFSGGSPL